MKLNGAIVGFGAVAEHGHLPGWRKAAGFDIVAIAEPSPERRRHARMLLPSAQIYADLDQLFEAEDLDFIDIASPPAAHEAAIAAATVRGIHVLCEKPLLTSLACYQRLKPTLEASDTVVLPVHNWKHSEAFRLAAAAIAAGELGSVQHVHLHTLRDGRSGAVNDWRSDPDVGGGGILVDHGWHAFYIGCALAGGQPRSVRASTDRLRYREADVEDTARCEIDLTSAEIAIDLTWAGTERRTTWDVVGSEGRLTICDDNVVIECGGESRHMKLRSSLSHGSHHAEWFPGVIDSFASEIREPKQRGVGLKEGLQCLSILDAAYRSAAGGKRVEIDTACGSLTPKGG